MKNIEDKNHHTMKKAYVENIILWMVMFVGFATMFFFVIDYATIIRVKDNMDALSDYGASRIARQGVATDMITELNNIAVSKVNTITSGNLVCTSVTNTPPDYQVIFITETTNTQIEFYSSKLTSRRVVFNEVNSQTVTCTLTITLN